MEANELSHFTIPKDKNFFLKLSTHITIPCSYWTEFTISNRLGLLLYLKVLCDRGMQEAPVRLPYSNNKKIY